MSNVKVKVSLSIVMLLVLVMALSSAFAVERIFNLSANYNGKALTDGETVIVLNNDNKVEITVNPKYVDNSLKIGYIWDDQAIKIAASGTKTATVSVPNFEKGTTHKLKLEALIEDNADHYVGNSNVLTVNFHVPSVDVNLTDGKTVFENGATITTKVGAELKAYGTSTRKVVVMAYRIDSEDLKVVKNASEVNITVPESFNDGKEHKIAVQCCTEDNMYSAGKTYKVVIKEEEPTTVAISLSVNGKELSEGEKTEVKSGDELVIKGTSNKKIAVIAYSIDKGELKTVENVNEVKITVPESFNDGKEHSIGIQCCTEDDVYSKSQNYTLFIKPEEVPEETTVDVNLKNGNTTLEEGTKTEVKVGDKLIIVGTSNKNVSIVAYRIDNGELQKVNGASKEIEVPESFNDGKDHKIAIQACTEDNVYSKGKIYTLFVKAEEPVVKPSGDQEPVVKPSGDQEPVVKPSGDQEPVVKPSGDKEPEKLTYTIEVGLDGDVLKEERTYEVNGGEKLSIAGKPLANITRLYAKWDDEDQEQLRVIDSVNIPTEAGKHILYVNAKLSDGTVTSKTRYLFTISEDENEELDVEPWMKENPDAEGLIISLRNDSENDDKANKNFYKLDEEVTYYVDYKNAGKAITKPVKVTLELPLTFTRVNLNGGSQSKQTITWNFTKGLEEDEAGTKIVKIKYKALSKKFYDNEIVYPVAKIYKDNKVQDKSAVINCIYTDEDTAFDEKHEPYMYGDRNEPTFRPDDSITRAEGALVLMRIFGVDYEDTVVTTRFSDIEETYMQARKAISEATRMGIIDGYTDGTYRPNDKMTRAEFMKIIACYIELKAEDDKVDGLEIKDESSIKVYKNRFGSTWASSYVTFLSRLNMTPVSSKDKDLRLDDEITRAEVAQLVNFYAFRAPAKVTSKISIDFVDVSRNHKLIGDIIEATRATHKVYINEDAKETGK